MAFEIPWEKYKQHRDRASQYPLDILVWGPGEGGGIEYDARLKIRDCLREAGHNADFSEDLIIAADALDDPIDDEILQADAADLIFMIYGSRGTQTEHDVILRNKRVATKAVIFVEDGMLSKIQTGLGAKSWEDTLKLAKYVITYKRKQLPRFLTLNAYEIAQKVRRACYARSIDSN